MTLSEAIEHCEEVAARYDCLCNAGQSVEIIKHAGKCADEHRQLADWLRVLKRILDSGDCNDCGIRKVCQIKPNLGEQVRYNCPLFVKEESE